VVIPTHNRPVELARLLSSILPPRPGLESLEVVVESLEVVVVDDGSAAGTYDALKARYPELKWMREAQSGPATARNRGWRAAGGSIVVFVDDDIVLDPDALVRLRDELDMYDAVGASIESLSPGRLVADFMHMEHLVTHKVEDDQVRWLVTACLAVRRKALELVGGFDERLLHGGEDVDLSLRMKAAGLQLSVCQDAVARHDHRASLALLVRTYYRHGTGQRRLAARHPERMGDLAHSTRARLSPAAWIRTYQTYRREEDLLTSAAFLGLRAGMMVPWLVGAARGSSRKTP